MREGMLTQSMRILAEILERRTGQTLAENRIWRLETSLRPIMRDHGLLTLDHLVAHIELEPGGALAQATINALLNNETSFFRDARVFQMLANDLIPHIVARAGGGDRKRTLRIWSAGCSSGQEAYSLAMMFRNHQTCWPGWKLQIEATDISSTAIARAKSGLVSQMEAQRGIAVNDLLRWMAPDGDQWRVNDMIMDMIDFRVDNLCEPKLPTGQFDLILCRNVLLYFSPERKRQILAALAKNSPEGGYLVLGAGETVIGQSADFVASAKFRGIYERIIPADAGAAI